MPPDPLPWDRFKERRYDRPPPDALAPGPRWRDPLPPHNGFRGRPIGNGRPGPWRYHSAESGRGCAPFRIDDKFIGDEGRLFGYHMDGRYNRFNRDNKGPLGHRDMRGHSWENGMSANSSGRPHFGSNLRSINERGSFGQKDLKAHWENSRLQNGSDQRSLDEKGSFARRDMRGKPWESGEFPDSSGRAHNGNDLCSVEEMVQFEKKNLKRHSPENGVLPNTPGRPRDSNDQRSFDDKGPSGQYDIRGKSCENGVFPSSCARLHTGSDQSSMDDKDIKGHSVENGVVPNRSDRLDCGSYQSPVDDMPTFASPAHSDVARTQVEQSKDQCDKSSGANDVVSGCKFKKENSLGPIDWKPRKWTRSGSLSSRGQKIEMSPLNATPLRSPSGETAACPTASAVSSEEAGSRKKPRLGWGEGLAKFEKKKVEGPDDDSATKPGLVVCVSRELSHVSSLADKSPRVAGFLECASPATPSSVACSSSPGVEVLEDKACVRSGNLDYDTCYSSGSPNLQLQEHTEGNQGRELCLENVDLTSVANLSSSLTEFQSEDPATVDSSFGRSTAMNKLLVWRSETLKALEITESEIDSLENDLKKLISNSGSICPHPEISSSSHGDFQEKPCEDVSPIAVSRPAPVQVISLGGVEKTSEVLGEELDEARNEDLVAPLSGFLEPLSEVKDAISFDSVQNDKTCDTIEVVAREKLEECPVYGSTSYDGCIEGLSSSKGADNLIAALSSVSEEALCDQILALNKDTAIKASEVFTKLSPSNDCSIHALKRISISSWKDDPRIMAKFAFKKRCSRFQERVNTLKYRALQLLWKEDLQLISLKKNRPKSQKRLEPSLRGPHNSNQKHRFSFRSRFSNPAGNLSLVSTAEVINFTSKLLSESHVKPCRNSLKMPALIMDKEERIRSRFISNNGLVEDPCAVEKERAMINPWTEEEKDIFMDKLVTFGKDFKKISSFLDHKTTANCVEFYYKNHKSDCFVKSKKKPDFANQGKSYSCNNYLVGSGKRWSREGNAASFDVLGEASAITAKADHAMKIRQETSGSIAAPINGFFERSHDLNISVHERETEAADVLVGICGSISSKATSPCITSSFDRGESNKDLTNQMAVSNDGSCSDDSCGEIESTDWTDEEKSILIQAFTSFGNDFAMMSRRVGTKSTDQCKVFFSKVRKCLGLDTFCPRPCIEGEDDNNGDGSDNGACVVEPDSAVSSEKSSFKGDTDVLLSHVDMNDLEKSDRNDPTESQKMMINELTEESKLAVNPEGEVKIENGVYNEPAIVPNPTSTVLHPDIEVDRVNGEALSSVGSVSADAGNDHGFSVFYAEGGKVEPDLVYGEPRAEQEMVPETILDDSSKDKLEATENGLRDLNCVVQDLHASCNASNVAPGSSDARMDVRINTKQDQKIALDLNPPLELLDIPLGEHSCPVNENSVSEGIASRGQDGFEKIMEKLYKKSTSMDSCTQHQTSYPVFAGFPLQVAVQRKMNGEYLSDMYPSQEGFLRRCSGSDTPSSVVDFSFQSHGQKKSHSRDDSWSSTDSEKPRSNGDVKLFGQILNSQPNGSINSIPENINQKLSGTNDVDSNSVVGKFARNNYLGLEDVPTRSLGFWDGNRIRIGFPSIPDSAMLLAKYPDAFGNFSTPSNIEQQQVLQSVVKSSNNNDRSFNGASVFPSREMTSGNEVVDYQLHRNQQGLTSEMQTQNGIGAFSSLRISDPVAAIKMHYVNNMVIEQESWRGKADIGR